jgi:hypothetical protein
MRPMFSIRYVAPSVALFTLLMARMLAGLGERSFRLSTAGIATCLVCLLPYYPRYDAWRDMARVVARGAASEPVFFESGYYGSDASGLKPDDGFPQGFLQVPFDRYFSGTNPRPVIDPSKQAQARLSIAQAATAANGAWLITGFDDEKAHAELPAHCFTVEKNGIERVITHIRIMSYR